MDLTQIQTLVGSLGVPTVMCGFLLWKGSQLIERNTQALNDMRIMIQSLIDKGGRN